MPVRLWTLTVGLLLWGCGGRADGKSSRYTTTDSAGVRIVESVSASWEVPRVIESEPLVRIGREAAGPYQFAFISDGLILEDGSIAVVEATTREVRFFDSVGQHTASFGGQGQGPGEFGSISGLFAYSADSLAAYDSRLRRTTVFDWKSGAYRTVSNAIEGNYYISGRTRAGPFLLYNPGSGYRPDLPAGLQWVNTVVIAMDPADGAYRDIAELPQREQFVEADGNTRPVIPGRYAIQAVAEDGFYWGTPDQYEIGFYDVDGVKRRILRRPIEPRLVQKAEIEAYIEAELDRVRRYEGEAAVPSYRRTYEEASYGETVPLFGTAFVDGDQRFWVSGPVWPGLQEPPSQWSVFSDEGLWLGDLHAPDRLRVLDARGDLVLGVWMDEFDVPHVQVHRIAGG